MKEIENKEWQQYVTQCTTGEWPVPASFVSDKDNWVCRAIVGRVLYFTKDLEGALTVLSTFVNDVRPDLADHPAEGMCEAEHFVLSLRGVTGITYLLASFRTAATCSVEVAQTTTSGRCMSAGSVSSSVLKRSSVSSSVLTLAAPTACFSSSRTSGVTGLYFVIMVTSFLLCCFWDDV